MPLVKEPPGASGKVSDLPGMPSAVLAALRSWWDAGVCFGVQVSFSRPIDRIGASSREVGLSAEPKPRDRVFALTGVHP